MARPKGKRKPRRTAIIEAERPEYDLDPIDVDFETVIPEFLDSAVRRCIRKQGSPELHFLRLSTAHDATIGEMVERFSVAPEQARRAAQFLQDHGLMHRLSGKVSGERQRTYRATGLGVHVYMMAAAINHIIDSFSRLDGRQLIQLTGADRFASEDDFQSWSNRVADAAIDGAQYKAALPGKTRCSVDVPHDLGGAMSTLAEIDKTTVQEVAIQAMKDLITKRFPGVDWRHNTIVIP